MSFTTVCDLKVLNRGEGRVLLKKVEWNFYLFVCYLGFLFFFLYFIYGTFRINSRFFFFFSSSSSDFLAGFTGFSGI